MKFFMTYGRLIDFPSSAKFQPGTSFRYFCACALLKGWFFPSQGVHFFLFNFSWVITMPNSFMLPSPQPDPDYIHFVRDSRSPLRSPSRNSGMTRTPLDSLLLRRCRLIPSVEYRRRPFAGPGGWFDPRSRQFWQFRGYRFAAIAFSPAAEPQNSDYGQPCSLRLFF